MAKTIIFALLVGLTYGIVVPLQRVGMKGLSPLAGALISNIVATLVLAIIFTFVGKGHRQIIMFNRSWCFMVASGVLLAFMVFCMMVALKSASGGVSIVAPIRGTTTLIVAVIIGCVLLGEQMNVMKLIGVVSCLTGIVLISWS